MIFQSCYPVELEGKDGPDIRSSVVVNPDTSLEKNVDQVSCTIKLGKIDCNYLTNFTLHRIALFFLQDKIWSSKKKALSLFLGKIDRQLFEFTINTLNNLYAEAEKANCSTYCEGE